MRLNGSNIQEAEILEESTVQNQPIADFDLKGFLASQFDSITANKKSGVITEALVLAELVKDKEKFRQIQENHPEVLNQYFEQLDYQKLVEDHGDKIEKPAKDAVKKALKNYAVPFLAGSGAGMLIAGFLKG